MMFGFTDILTEGKPAWMGERQYASLSTIGRSVAERTGTRMVVSFQRNTIAWAYDVQTGLPSIAMDLPLYEGDKPVCLDPICDGYSADEVVYSIQLGKVDKKLKDRWNAGWNRRRESDQAEREGRWCEERRTRAMRNMEKIHRRVRLSTGSEIRRWWKGKV